MNHHRIHHLKRVPTYLSLANHYSLSTSPFLDFYSFLQVPPTASPTYILSAWNTTVDDFESHIDNFTNLDLRKRTIGLLGTTLHILLDPTERLLYDIHRTMTLGKINLSRPNHDLPSLHVTQIRHSMIWSSLRCVVVEATYIEERIRQELHGKESTPYTPLQVKYLHVVNTLESFVQQAFEMQQVLVAILRLLDSTAENEWDEGIRDLRLDERGIPTKTCRSALLYLQAVEDRIHSKFWVKIAEAAADKYNELDDEYMPEDDIDRIIGVLSHVRC